MKTFEGEIRVHERKLFLTQKVTTKPLSEWNRLIAVLSVNIRCKFWRSTSILDAKPDVIWTVFKLWVQLTNPRCFMYIAWYPVPYIRSKRKEVFYSRWQWFRLAQVPIDTVTQTTHKEATKYLCDRRVNRDWFDLKRRQIVFCVAFSLSEQDLSENKKTLQSVRE